jgi:hypothetical protein
VEERLDRQDHLVFQERLGREAEGALLASLVLQAERASCECGQGLAHQDESAWLALPGNQDHQGQQEL